MESQPICLFDLLTEIHQRPEPFSAYTAETLWNDEHISKQMLDFHLDEKSAPASRPHEFIQRSADWITERFALAQGKRVADFGCGPGLYTTRFAAAGAKVTGIDFSSRSLAHAEQEAQKQGLAIDYIQGNYLERRPGGVFDLITLIYCDLCPLSPDQRRRLLNSFRDQLADGGSLLLDVFTLEAYVHRQETVSHGFRLMDGFWAPGEYWGFMNTFKYDDLSVVLDKYTIVEPHRTRTVYNWLQYFSLDVLAEEFAQCGLRIIEKYADVAGSAHVPGDTLAVVACKA